jgi:epoxyqueuosine reductase QueG
MADRVMTDRLRAEALGMGMDLVGFGPVARWENAPYLLSPRAILPDSRTVIVCGIHITDSWTEMGGEPEPQDRSAGGWQDQNSLMDRVAYRLVRLLDARGYKGIAIASSNIWRYRQFEGIPSLFAPDLSHILASAAAGLSEIGWHGIAINPEFGARTRYISVVTDAELTPTPMYDGPKLCDMCMACVKHCPTAALRKELLPPHEVKIENKTFRYANKNIWRCAWAEHFNLDLNSKNLLKMEKVGEAEILGEIAAKGTRGHERGVCQKVCVPPHLRTDEPSFGRPGKLIAQHRINRRYPDNMPTLRKLRDDLSAAAIRMGADLVRVGPLTADLETVPGYTLTRELPGARTVIGLVWRAPDGAWDSVPMHLAASMNYHHVLLRLARLVEECGYHAASYSAWHEREGLAGSLAEMLDLGRPSARNPHLAESAEFGGDVWLGAVVTDAPLDPTPPAEAAAPARPRRLDPVRLRRRLEALADDSHVTRFGIAPAARFDRAVGELSATVDLHALGERVEDVGATYHGAFEPRIIRETARVLAPADHLPGAKSVIVLGLDFPEAIVAHAGRPDSQQIGPYAFWQYQTRNELAFAAFELAKVLQEQGHRAVVSEDMLGIQSLVASHRGMLPDARCNAIEAVAAGFGRLGRHGALLSPESGSRMRQIVIVTDAELPADAIALGDDPCAACAVCAETCPMTALNEKNIKIHLDKTVVLVPGVNRGRCDWSKRYALCPEEGPAMIGNKTDVPRPVGNVTIEQVAEAVLKRDPVMKRRPCILERCLQECPAGRARQ